MSGSDGVIEYKPEMSDPDSMAFKKVAEAVENQVRKKHTEKFIETEDLICLINLKS